MLEQDIYEEFDQAQENSLKKRLGVKSPDEINDSIIALVIKGTCERNMIMDIHIIE